MDLTERRLEREKVFDGRLLQVYRDRVALPDGAQTTREWIQHPGAVMIIPLSGDDAGDPEVILERQFRYPVGETFIEFPAGKLDAGEAPIHCAQRELREETGYSAAEWARAGVLHPAIGYSSEGIEIWFARGLTAGEQHLDRGEFVEVFTARASQVLAWCREGVITDGKTLSGALWLQNVMNGQWGLKWMLADDPDGSPGRI